MSPSRFVPFAISFFTMQSFTGPPFFETAMRVHVLLLLRMAKDLSAQFLAT